MFTGTPLSCMASWACRWDQSKPQCWLKMFWQLLRWRRFSMSCGTIQQDSTVASGIIQHHLLTSLVRISSWKVFLLLQRLQDKLIKKSRNTGIKLKIFLPYTAEEAGQLCTNNLNSHVWELKQLPVFSAVPINPRDLNEWMEYCMVIAK